MTTENLAPWVHLPNAARIAWCVADATRQGGVWITAGGIRGKAMNTAAAMASTAHTAAWDTAWDLAISTAHKNGRGDERETALTFAPICSWGAVSALIAWDECGALLETPVDAVRLMAAAGHHPAVLLLPAVIVRNRP